MQKIVTDVRRSGLLFQYCAAMINQQDMQKDSFNSEGFNFCFYKENRLHRQRSQE